jgi:hypothetical protein
MRSGLGYEDTVRVLASAAPGTFLLRWSGREPGGLVLAAVAPNGCVGARGRISADASCSSPCVLTRDEDFRSRARRGCLSRSGISWPSMRPWQCFQCHGSSHTCTTPSRIQGRCWICAAPCGRPRGACRAWIPPGSGQPTAPLSRGRHPPRPVPWRVRVSWAPSGGSRLAAGEGRWKSRLPGVSWRPVRRRSRWRLRLRTRSRHCGPNRLRCQTRRRPTTRPPPGVRWLAMARLRPCRRPRPVQATWQRARGVAHCETPMIRPSSWEAWKVTLMASTLRSCSLACLRPRRQTRLSTTQCPRTTGANAATRRHRRRRW